MSGEVPGLRGAAAWRALRLDAVIQQYYVVIDPICVQETFSVSYRSVSGHSAIQLTTLMWIQQGRLRHTRMMHGLYGIIPKYATGLNQLNWFKISPKKVSEIERFPKKVNKIERFPKKVNKMKLFPKNVNEIEYFPKTSAYRMSWLIGLNHLSHSFDLIESIHMYLVTWLNWLVYSSYTDSWWLEQFIVTFYHDWVDWFGMSRIQVCWLGASCYC